MKECAQQGDSDPGVRECLREIKKTVLSMMPGQDQRQYHWPKCATSGITTGAPLGTVGTLMYAQLWWGMVNPHTRDMLQLECGEGTQADALPRFV